MVFVSNDKPPEILKPGKEPFYPPSSAVRSQFPSILGFRFLSSLSMWRDHFNTTFIAQLLIKAITVIGFITNEFIRSILSKSAVYGFLDQFHFVGRSAFNVSGDRNTRASAIAMILVPLPRFVLPTARPPFLPVRSSRR